MLVMNTKQRRESFQDAGFLGEHVPEETLEIRAQNRDWFELAEDLSRVLQASAARGAETNRGANFEPKTVATRLLMRSCGTFQGAILMAERGMVTEGQTLVRSLLENAFCMAALHDRPDEFVALLKADAEAARREQGRFILAQDLVESLDAATQERFKKVIASIGKDPAFLSPKKVAAMGPLIKQYLAYQKLSNDAAHPSAASLHRFAATNAARSGWNYRWGPGKEHEIAFTLSQSILAAIPIGVGFTQLSGDVAHNRMLIPLADRFQALPEPESRVDISSIGL